MPDHLPVVGVAVLVLKQGRLLLGRRRKSPGAGSWQLPGGLLEKSETVFDAAQREVLEETGLRISQLQPGPYTNNIFPDDDVHSVTLYVRAVYTEGELVDAEPHAGSDWGWYAMNELPQPLFLPLQHLVDEHQTWMLSA